jgi:hypothetical protein
LSLELSAIVLAHFVQAAKNAKKGRFSFIKPESSLPLSAFSFEL